MEMWKPVVGYDGHYEVSNFGRVRRLGSKKCLKPGKSKFGYLRVVLCVDSRPKSFDIHRLVAKSFLGEPPSDSHVVAHGDGNPSNNRLANLRWATKSENSFDQVLHGTQKGKHHGRKSGLTDEQVVAIRSDHRSSKIIGKEYGISAGTVTQIRRRETYKYIPPNEGDYEPKKICIKFSNDDVRRIRSDKRTNTEIASEIGCSYVTIWAIKTRKSYAHVPDKPQGKVENMEEQESEEKNNIVIVGDLALIELTKGHTAIIDTSDVEVVRDYKWRSAKGKGTNYVCARRKLDDGRVKTIFLHRLLMNPERGLVVDHINGEGLDNRRTNLRVVTVAQNNLNSRVRSDSQTGVKGAYYDKRKGTYYSRIRANDKSMYLGTFKTAEEAAQAYAEASEKYHGEYGRTYLDD